MSDGESEKGPGRRCVFCGGGPTTNEHVWPKWVRGVPSIAELRDQPIPPTSERNEVYRVETWRDPETREVHQDVHFQGRWVPPTDLTVRKVCAGCNNGWMSRLEGSAVSTIRPLVNGEHVPELDSAAVQVLATWATKTAFMKDISRPESRVVTDKQLHRLMSSGRPPHHVTVWAAPYTSGLMNSGIWSHPFGLSDTGSPPDGKNFSVHILAIGGLYLQVAIASSTAIAEFALPRVRAARTAARVWPGPARLRWSEMRPLTDDWVQEVIDHPMQ